jgi:hypothetical protein
LGFGDETKEQAGGIGTRVRDAASTDALAPIAEHLDPKLIYFFVLQSFCVLLWGLGIYVLNMVRV